MRPPAREVSPEPKKAICPSDMSSPIMSCSCTSSRRKCGLSVGRSVKFIYYLKKFCIRRNIRHRSAIVGKAHVALGVDHTIQRHPAQLEKIDFLAVHSSHRVIWVGQPNKGDSLIFPISLKNRP